MLQQARKSLTADCLCPERPSDIFDSGLAVFAAISIVNGIITLVWLGVQFPHYLGTFNINLADGPADAALALSQVEALRGFFLQGFHCQFSAFLIASAISFMGAVCIPYLIGYFIYSGRGTQPTAFEIALVPILAVAAWQLYLYIPTAAQQIATFNNLSAHDMCKAVGGWLIPKLCNVATDQAVYFCLGGMLSVVPTICTLTEYCELTFGILNRRLTAALPPATPEA